MHLLREVSIRLYDVCNSQSPLLSFFGFFFLGFSRSFKMHLCFHTLIRIFVTAQVVSFFGLGFSFWVSPGSFKMNLLGEVFVRLIRMFVTTQIHCCLFLGFSF